LALRRRSGRGGRRVTEQNWRDPERGGAKAGCPPSARGRGEATGGWGEEETKKKIKGEGVLSLFFQPPLFPPHPPRRFVD